MSRQCDFCQEDENIGFCNKCAMYLCEICRKDDKYGNPCCPICYKELPNWMKDGNPRPEGKRVRLKTRKNQQAG